jgi:hypothetical protein
MRKWLNIAAGVTGVFAALLWFLFARTLPAPAQGAYWDVTDNPNMPFHRKWRRSSALNAWAAFLTGVSILLTSIAQFGED